MEVLLPVKEKRISQKNGSLLNNSGSTESSFVEKNSKVSSKGRRSSYSDVPLYDPASSIQTQGNSNNNSNVEEFQASKSDKKKLSKLPVTYHKGNVEVTLEGKTLWDEFYHRGTEMIVNRAGRRMFPGFSVAIGSLKPKVKYSMKLEVVLADNHRFKFLNSRWLAVGSAEPQPLTESYVHPDSPNSGAFWMRHGVSFRKLKITNNKEQPGNNALLYSMHKYFLRLVVEEEQKFSQAHERISRKTVLRVDFPETTFVAVTAYQNEEVTQLKITNNPFAKAFRENATDMEWETSQMLYPNQSILPASQGLPSCWPSPVSGYISPNTTGYFPPASMLSMSPVTTPSMASPHYFQWPGQSAPEVSSPANPPFSIYHAGEGSVYAASYGANLPDFETVFTPVSS